jgi:hypothetical protein
MNPSQMMELQISGNLIRETYAEREQTARYMTSLRTAPRIATDKLHRLEFERMRANHLRNVNRRLKMQDRIRQELDSI